MTAMLSAAAVVLMTAGVLAQAKPNFAGKWTMDAGGSGCRRPRRRGGGGGGRGGGRGGGGGWGMELTIAQDATTLTIDVHGRRQTPAPVSYVYKLDGTESKNIDDGPRRRSRPSRCPRPCGRATRSSITTTHRRNGEQKRVVRRSTAATRASRPRRRPRRRTGHADDGHLQEERSRLSRRPQGVPNGPLARTRSAAARAVGLSGRAEAGRPTDSRLAFLLPSWFAEQLAADRLSRTDRPDPARVSASGSSTNRRSGTADAARVRSGVSMTVLAVEDQIEIERPRAARSPCAHAPAVRLERQQPVEQALAPASTSRPSPRR